VIPPDRPAVLTLSGTTAVPTVIESGFVAVCAVVAESRACTVKEEVPAVVGVPEITPVEAFKLNPAGNEPVVILQV
jgi:hypothetical protein